MAINQVSDKQFAILQNFFRVKDTDHDRGISTAKNSPENGWPIRGADRDHDQKISDMELAEYYHVRFAYPNNDLKVGEIPLFRQAFSPEKQHPQAVLELIKNDETTQKILSAQNGICLHNEKGAQADADFKQKIALALYTIGRLPQSDLKSLFLDDKIMTAVDGLQKEYAVPGPCYDGNKIGPKTLEALFSELEALAPLWDAK